MNIYPDRINELHAFLERVYGVRDRQAVEILLAAMLPSATTRRARPWVIIETDYLSRDTSDAWFSFGGCVTTWCLAVARILRCQKMEEIVREWIGLKAQGATGIYVEPDWQRLPGEGRGHSLLYATSSYRALLGMCIRLRVEHPKNGRALRTEDERATDRAELRRLASRVLDSAMRNSHYRLYMQHDTQACSVASNTDRPIVQSLLYWCEMLQKSAPLQSNWEALVGNVVGIASGIAALHNDGRDPDWLAAERVMRDSIPYPVERLLCGVSGMRAAVNAFALARDSGDQVTRPVEREIHRLRRERVLSRYGPKRYYVKDQAWIDLLDRDKRILL